MNISTVAGERLIKLFKVLNRFMLVIWRLGLGSWGNGTKFGGSVMILRHRGRKTGLLRSTPLNYAVVEGDIYCMSGFGRSSDWYQNVLAHPLVEIWLPDGRWLGQAEDANAASDAMDKIHKVLVASGFAGPLFGFNPRRMSEADYRQLLDDYRLVRIRPVKALTGPGGPGDLAWVWPVSTFILLGVLIRKRVR